MIHHKFPPNMLNSAIFCCFGCNILQAISIPKFEFFWPLFILLEFLVKLGRYSKKAENNLGWW